MHVLITGMSGTGKSSLVLELRSRGYIAYDADADGFSEPRRDGRWGWRTEAIAELLSRSPDQTLFFAGCSEEQAELPFDYRVLLTAPDSVVIERLRSRTNNPYGKSEPQLSQVLTDRVEIEPLIRRSADLVLTTTEPPDRVADALLRQIASAGQG